MMRCICNSVFKHIFGDAYKYYIFEITEINQLKTYLVGSKKVFRNILRNRKFIVTPYE